MGLDFTWRDVQIDIPRFSDVPFSEIDVEFRIMKTVAAGSQILPRGTLYSARTNAAGRGLSKLPVYDDGTSLVRFECVFPGNWHLSQSLSRTTFNFYLRAGETITLAELFNQSSPTNTPQQINAPVVTMQAVQQLLDAALNNTLRFDKDQTLSSELAERLRKRLMIVEFDASELTDDVANASLAATNALSAASAATAAAATAATLAATANGALGSKAERSELFKVPAQVNKTGNFTVSETDHTIILTGGDATGTLLSAIGRLGRVYEFKKIGTGIGTISAPEPIEGEANVKLYPGDSLKVQSDDQQWIKI